MFDEDMGVFYAEFGTQYIHPDSNKKFTAIVGAVDVEALDGYVMNAEMQLNYQTHSVTLRADDVVHELNQAGDFVAAWRLLEHPRRVNDGHETVAILGRAQP